MERLGTAVIGLGAIAGSHLSAIQRLNDRFELVAGVDPRGGAAGNASKLRDAPLLAGEAEMHENISDAHAVAICTPHHLHIRNIRSAVAHGARGILIEKPVTTTPADMDEVIELSERHPVRVSVGYILRHNPLFIKMHRLVNTTAPPAPCPSRQIHSARAARFILPEPRHSCRADAHPENAILSGSPQPEKASRARAG